MGAAFRAWFDGGAERDAQLTAIFAPAYEDDADIATVTARYTPSPHVPGRPLASDSWSRVALLLASDRPSWERARAVGALTMHWNHDAMIFDRQQAISWLHAEPPCAETVRRAAWWESGDINFVTPARVAWEKLGACAEPAAAALILRKIHAQKHVPVDVMRGAGERVDADDKPFIAALLHYVAADHDGHSEWAVSQLRERHAPALLPLMLGWLKAPNPELRFLGAFTLESIGSAQIVPALRTALSAEKDERARRCQLQAIAQWAGPPTSELLLVELHKPQEATTYLVLANALARLKEKRALAPLAHLALSKSKDTDAQVVMEAVEAFGWISGRYTAYAPAESAAGASRTIETERMERGLAEIRAWLQEPAAQKP